MRKNGDLDRQIQERETRLSQEQVKLDRLKARKVLADRKADTRRKILAGAVILKKAKDDPEFEERLTQWLDDGLTVARDRSLFGLPDKKA